MAFDEQLQAIRVRYHDELKIPVEALPVKKPRGQKNYTIKSGCKAVIEVQHFTRTHYVKMPAGHLALGAGVSPSVSWGKFGGPAEAWAQAKSLAEVAGAWASVVD